MYIKNKWGYDVSNQLSRAFISWNFLEYGLTQGRGKVQSLGQSFIEEKGHTKQKKKWEKVMKIRNKI